MANKLLKYICPIIIGIAVWLFWWLCHPEVLAYHEEYQMFQTTWDYFLQHLITMGGLSVYVSEYLAQLNIYPIAGAAVIGAEMAIVYLLVAGSFKRQWIGNIIAIALIVALCWMMGDENLLPSFSVAILFLVADIRLTLSFRNNLSKHLAAIAMHCLLLWSVAGTHYRIPHQFLSTPGFDEEKSEVLRFDMLARNGEWKEIIKMAERKSPTHPLGIQAVNLALAKQNWLGDRMFSFNQTGMDGLFYPWRNNSVDNVISSEIAWHIGLVNTAFRYSFDCQETIPDKRKSARLMKRMAECCIVNGDYKAAEKYLNKLKHTNFYKKWAERAEGFLYDENKIARHPIWGEKRLVRFKQNYLFSYPELHKILALLAIESNGRNRIAWDYFCAACLLRGDLQVFGGMNHYAKELFGETVMPRHHQEAWAILSQQMNRVGDYGKYYMRKQQEGTNSNDATTSASVQYK